MSLGYYYNNIPQPAPFFYPGTLWQCSHEPFHNFRWPGLVPPYIWYIPQPLVIPMPRAMYDNMGLLMHIVCLLDPSESEDRRALLALSLTSRHWHWATIPYLFRVLRVCRPNTLSKVLQAFDISHLLAGLVKELHIKVSHDDLQLHYMLHLKILLTTAHFSPRVLQIEHLNDFDKEIIRKSLNPQFGLYPRGASMVGELKLRFCTFRDITAFQMLLMTFSSIVALSLDVVSWSTLPSAESENVTGIQRPAGTLGLKSLSIGRHCDLDVILSWYLHSVDLAGLKKMAFLSLGAGDVHVLKSFLPPLRAEIEELTFGFTFHGVPNAFIGEFFVAIHATLQLTLAQIF